MRPTPFARPACTPFPTLRKLDILYDILQIVFILGNKLPSDGIFMTAVRREKNTKVDTRIPNIVQTGPKAKLTLLDGTHIYYVCIIFTRSVDHFFALLFFFPKRKFFKKPRPHGRNVIAPVRSGHSTETQHSSVCYTQTVSFAGRVQKSKTGWEPNTCKPVFIYVYHVSW